MSFELLIERDARCQGWQVYFNGSSFLVRDGDYRYLETLRKLIKALGVEWY